MKKLVFIEGVSGVGKTITAVKLCDALLTRGYSTICHLEGDADNPVDFFNCSYLTKTEFLQLLHDYPTDNSWPLPIALRRSGLGNPRLVLFG